MNADEFWTACQDLHGKTVRSGYRNFETKVFGGTSPFLQVIRLLDLGSCDNDHLEDSSSEIPEEIEDNVVYSVNETGEVIRVEYSISYSVTYQVPVLYFQVIDVNGTTNQLQFVYDHLVPRSRLGELQGTGIIGGISQTNHPATDIPCFYVHPCRTVEAMQSLISGREVSPKQYLQIWIGLIGSAVGLNLPIELVA